MLNSSRTPVPIAVIRAWTSVFCSTLSIRDFSTLRIFPRNGSTAWVFAVAALLGRAAGGVALDDEQLGQRRVLDRAVGELARQGRVLERRLAPGQIARLARGLARTLGLHRLAMITARASLGFSSRNSPRAGVDDRLDEARHARVAELRLRLALELRDRAASTEITAVSPSRTSSPDEIVLFLLEQAVVARVLVQRAGQRRAEAAQVRAALAAC